MEHTLPVGGHSPDPVLAMGSPQGLLISWSYLLLALALSSNTAGDPVTTLWDRIGGERQTWSVSGAEGDSGPLRVTDRTACEELAQAACDAAQACSAPCYSYWANTANSNKCRHFTSCSTHETTGNNSAGERFKSDIYPAASHCLCTCVRSCCPLLHCRKNAQFDNSHTVIPRCLK